MTVCKSCGAPVERVGNYYVCDYCGNKWEIDSGNDILYAEALQEGTEDVFAMEEKLKKLPEDFLQTKELLTFIKNNKAYKGKKYQHPNKLYDEIRLQFKLKTQDGKLTVRLYHVDKTYSYSELSLKDKVKGKHTMSSSKTNYIVISETNLKVYNYYWNGTQTFNAVN